MAIGIIAAHRNKWQYLTQTVGYLFNEVEDAEWPVIVCFVEEEPNGEIDKLKDLGVNIAFLYEDRAFPNLPHGQSDQRIYKESQDYWTCLKKTQGLFNASYVLLLEDDALPIPGFVYQVWSVINQLDDERMYHVDYVKLSHPWYLRKSPSLIQVGRPRLKKVLEF